MPEQAKLMIRIVSPNLLDAAKAEAIAEAFSKHHNLPALELIQQRDPSLLGGFVVYLQGKRYDYSLKGQLASIDRELSWQSKSGPDEQTDLKAQMRKELQEKTAALENVEAYDKSLSFLWEKEAEPLDEHEKKDDVHLLMDDYLNLIRSGELASHQLVDEVGEVVSVGDGVAYVSGLENCKNDELLVFSPRTVGIAMNLERERVGVVLLGEVDEVKEASVCKRSGQTISVPVGDALLGRVVNPLGTPLDGEGPIRSDKRYPIEREAANVIDRQPVSVPLYTGITAIDAMTPIGRGQRELVIGDRQTGKTAIALDTILNQKGKNVRCVYVAIGQKLSNLANLVQLLKERGAMDYTTVVIASASDQASMQYIAPYAGCAIAESWMYESHADVLVVYDDLTKHAQAYRALSLLLRRPPGREAFPGDVFYLHSRLLERACRLSDEKGGGSITAIPIVETQAGDISSYIPTNVISITDGQIYLETDLFFSGQRPAINVGLSVSRVGGAAQTKLMKTVAGSLRINLAQYKEIAAFSQFGSELDEETKQQLARGGSLNEVLIQPQFQARTMAESSALLFLATEGLFAKLDKSELKYFCQKYLDYLRLSFADSLASLQEGADFSAELREQLKANFEHYYSEWLIDREKSTDARV